MLKKIVFLISFSLFSAAAFSQSKSDIIYLLDGQKKVNIKEVGLNSIKYTHPNEETVYTISKYQVSKIVFASGREEVFESPIKEVSGLSDFKKVYITYNPEEIAGLQPKGQLFSKATGLTTLSSINEVNNRALDKLKMEASMIGANVVFIGNTFQRGNQYGGENQVGSSTQTSFSGMAFSTNKSNIQAVKSKIESQSFHHYQTQKLNRNSWSPNRILASKNGADRKPFMFKIEEIIEKDGELFVKTKNIPSKLKELKVIYSDDEKLILMERNDKETFNYLLITDQSNYLKNLSL